MAPSTIAGARRPVRDLPPLGNQDLDALSRACGIPLRAYRADHVAERVARSIDREGTRTAHELAALLRRSPEARERFRRAIAISVTGRLRDPQQFEVLRERVLPELLAMPGDLRVWCAGCANGVELFDVAALIDGLGALDRTQLLGSDLLEQNIAEARAGGPDGPLPSGGVLARARWEVRDLTSQGAPDGRFRLILCRNVGIYLEPDARARLMTMLAGALAPGGVLMLGRSERLVAPEADSLAAYAPHAYRRLA
jgi:chemotaxis protein methyltransferase CheR